MKLSQNGDVQFQTRIAVLTHWSVLAVFCFSLMTGGIACAQLPPPPGGGTYTNNPPYTNLPLYASPDGSTIDLNISYVGTIRLALYDRDKPATVKNFINYVQSGAYSNNIIHYDAANSLCQGGSLNVVKFGSGGQAIVPVSENAPVANELRTGRFFSNVRGTIAMVHYPGDTNNTTCHWFINLADNTGLDAPDANHAYVVFGHVVSGLANLDKLNPTSNNTTIKLANLGGWLTSCPINYAASLPNVTYANLLSVSYNIVTLDVNLRAQHVSANTTLLSWQSISNKAFTLYYEPQVVGSSWTALLTTNGNGSVQSFRHVSSSATGFYRVSYQP